MRVPTVPLVKEKALKKGVLTVSFFPTTKMFLWRYSNVWGHINVFLWGVGGGRTDSKQLTELQREVLFEKIVNASDIGFEVAVLSAEDLSNKMLRMYLRTQSISCFLACVLFLNMCLDSLSALFFRAKYNLNEISHDTAIQLLQRALEKGVPIKEVCVCVCVRTIHTQSPVAAAYVC